jgi:hypothetical protein
LTSQRALQTGGLACVGGARSLDQEIGARTSAPGRFGTRVYGYDYQPNAVVVPFSMLGPGQPAPKVSRPQDAFNDLLGLGSGADGTATGDPREASVAALRGSVLDAVSREYEAIAPKLDADGRRTLDEHRALVRQLEASLSVPKSTSGSCAAAPPTETDPVRAFMHLTQIAFACDLTRVVTFVAPVPEPSELGYATSSSMHLFAHESMYGATSCGLPFDPLAEEVITQLGAWYARHFAALLDDLASVPEGDGTLLDHTVVVWCTELATPTHVHHDTFTVLAGGCNDFFQTGRYVRYPRIYGNPIAGFPATGPAHNRLHVTLLRAMGYGDDAFGMTSATAADGAPIPMTGPLTELAKTV